MDPDRIEPTPYITDEKGFASLPLPGRFTRIEARQNGLFGFVEPNDGASMPTGFTLIRVEEDDLITIHVVNEKGEAEAGQRVLLRQIHPNGSQKSVWAISNEEGMATLNHPFHILSKLGNRKYGFGFHGAGAATSPELYSLWDLPREVTLVSKPTGSIRLQLLYADGSVYKGNARISLKTISSSKSPRLSWEKTELDDASILLEGVALGAQFELSVRFGKTRAPTQTFFGPERPNELVEVSAKCLVEHAFLPITVLKIDGTLLSSAEIISRIYTQSDRPREFAFSRLTTSKDGQLLIAIPQTSHEKKYRGRGESITDHFVHLRWTDPESKLSYESQLSLGSALPKGTMERKSMKLELVPILAGGHVLDEQGLPVPNLWVKVYETKLGRGAKHMRTLLSATRTDANGGFTIQGNVTPDVVYLQGHEREVRTDVIPVQRGSLDHELTLPPLPYRLQGQIQLPEQLRGTPGFVGFYIPSSTELVASSTLREGDGDFHFNLASDAEGLLEYRSNSGISVSMDNIFPSKENRPGDSRLQPWDLKKEITFSSVDVILEGKPISEFTLGLVESRMRERLREIPGRERNQYAIPTATSHRAYLRGEGFQSQGFLLRPGSQVVHVQPELWANFHLPSELKLPPDSSLYFDFLAIDQYEPGTNSTPSLDLGFSDGAMQRRKIFRPSTWTNTAIIFDGTDSKGNEISFTIFDASMGTPGFEVQIPESSVDVEVELPLSQSDFDLALRQSGWVIE